MLFFLSAIDSFEERNEEELGSEKKALPQVKVIRSEGQIKKHRLKEGLI